MIKAGITGGMGSGKTYVCRVFENLGVPVFYADEESRKISSLPHVVEAIRETFGAAVVDAKKAIDRKKLAGLVFNKPEELKKLNSIIHPLVQEKFEKWCEGLGQYPYILKEAAILFESGSYRQLDKVITITSPLPLRIQRLQGRDSSLGVAEIEKRMKAQWSDEEKIKRSDFVIRNEENTLLLPQVLLIHEQLRASGEVKDAGGSQSC